MKRKPYYVTLWYVRNIGTVSGDCGRRIMAYDLAEAKSILVQYNKWLIPKSHTVAVDGECLI